MRLYRVFPWNRAAAEDRPGGALYAPASTSGRIDNPTLYQVLYLSSHPEGAVAESLGRLRIWRDESFLRTGVRLALAVVEVEESTQIVDLTRVEVLVALGVVLATEVISRDRASTQSLARRVFERGRSEGMSWWSYYNPDWLNVGLWSLSSVHLIGTPELLATEHPAVVAAAESLPRQIVEGRSRRR
ncbi:MAG: RES family NAD+ phosphorylase [Candidatus Baltobacteraceae bacterium]